MVFGGGCAGDGGQKKFYIYIYRCMGIVKHGWGGGDMGGEG